MSVKSSVVLKSEFSIPFPDGSGSRGATPGRYVLRYMARDGACEPVAPIRKMNTDVALQRFARREQLLRDRSDVIGSVDAAREVLDDLYDLQVKGGVAFGYGEASLSDEGVVAASRDIQQLFNSKHTVVKMVLSFSQEYLHEMGVVDDDYAEVTTPGAYRGNVDHMKLRKAVMAGMDNMGRQYYDDLRYVGTIQVDTEHVHAHLAFVDAGRGRRMPNGEQRGKLTQDMFAALRKGVDDHLHTTQTLAPMYSAARYDAAHVRACTAHVVQHDMMVHGALQQIQTALPENRQLWQATSVDPAMEQAHRLAKAYVYSVMVPDVSTGMAEQMMHADTTQRTQIEQAGMQSVYDTIGRAVDSANATADAQVIIDTPELLAYGTRFFQREASRDEHDADDGPGMGTTPKFGKRRKVALNTAPDELDEDTVAATAGISLLCERIQVYQAQYMHHQEQMVMFGALYEGWAEAAAAGNVADDAYVMGEFYRTEHAYHRAVMEKYAQVLPVDTRDAFAHEEQRARRIARELTGVEGLYADTEIRDMVDGLRAERVGQQRYGVDGGRHMVQQKTSAETKRQRGVIRRRIHGLRQRFDHVVERVKTLAKKLGYTVQQYAGSRASAEFGEDTKRKRDHVVDFGAQGSMQCAYEPMIDVTSFSGVDLHDFGDYAAGIAVNDDIVLRYDRLHERRAAAYDAAMSYLDHSGQRQHRLQFLHVGQDIQAAKWLSGQLMTSLVRNQSVVDMHVAHDVAPDVAGDVQADFAVSEKSTVPSNILCNTGVYRLTQPGAQPGL